MDSEKHQFTPRIIFRIVLCYGGFLVYGSLIPFHFQWRDFDDAWSHYLVMHADGVAGISWQDFLTNITIYMPLGFFGTWALLASQKRSVRKFSLLLAITSCCLFSALIEFMQLYFPPRLSWAYDTVGNCFGYFFGYLSWKFSGSRFIVFLEQRCATWHYPDRSCWSPRQRVSILLAYLVGLTLANNWYEGPWLSSQDAIARLTEFNFLPFYYYQEASTWVALISAFWHFIMYLPVGIGFFFLAPTRSLLSKSVLWQVGISGAAIAVLIEAGKIFLSSRHPDSGNIVVGSLAAVTGFLSLPYSFKGIPAVRKTEANSKVLSSASTFNSISLARLFAFGILLSVIGLVSRFPVQPSILAIFIFAYAVMLIRWQCAWLWVLPATLPVFDLAPYSGWFFLDEFDLLILVTLAALLWQRRTDNTQKPAWGVGYWLASFFLLSTSISLIVGLFPLQPIDQNAFSNYLSHYNALRIAKGVAWAFFLVTISVNSHSDKSTGTRAFCIGTVIGLAMATTLAVWERTVYPGLLNFSSEFRIGAFFSSMHNGGSHIEAYFTMAMPFALTYAYITKSQTLRWLMAGLLVSCYVVLVTFARGGYVSFVVAFSIIAVSLWRAAYLENRRSVLPALGGLISISLLLATPIFIGPFAQQRLATSGTDLGVRQTHWKESLRLMSPSISTALFGMGLGRFPESHYFGNTAEGVPAIFRYEQEADNGYLMLGAGQPLYVEQIIDVAPEKPYHLSFDSRSAQGNGIINILLCERTYFYSYGCVSVTRKHETEGGKWAHHDIDIFSEHLAEGSWLMRRAVKLSLENAAKTTIDIDNVVLRNEMGSDLVVNGGFQNGNSNWFFSSPFNHLPWHIKNLWIGLYFDQGWFGLLSFAGLVAFASFTLARSTWNGNIFAGASLASMAGFLCVGLFDSLFDAPRLINLLLLILFIPGCLLVKRTTGAHENDVITSTLKTRPPTDPSHAPPSGYKPVYGSGRGSLNYRSILHILIGFTFLTIAVCLVTQLPQVPYNLRALPNPYHPILAPLILAAFFYWVFATPAWTSLWLESSRKARLLFPIWIVLHGIIAWALLRNAVLPVMIHKVAGAPVLGWSWEWETLIRFGVLEATFFALLTGGVVIARSIWDRSRLKGLIAWIACSSCLLPISYFIIVENAATDNLVELIAGGGAKGSLYIAAWILVVGIGAFPLAKLISTREPSGPWQFLISVLSLPLGYILLSLGMEPSLEKFGHEFSGIQFLLSMDRAHYATGWSLWLRYGIFHGGLLSAIAIAQYPFWLSQRKSKTPQR
jgi:VanZ family protein